MTMMEVGVGSGVKVYKNLYIIGEHFTWFGLFLLGLSSKNSHKKAPNKD